MEETTETSSADDTPDVNHRMEPLERSAGSKLFLFLLGGVSILYAAVLIYHVSVPPGAPARQAFLEQCRQICLRYGLVSTNNVRHDARAFLTAVEAKPLSEALSDILSDSSFVPAETQTHSLLGQKAPDFELLSHEGKIQSLQDFLNDGPVMVVFYYGFHCSHCVAQLFAINDDLKHFRELGIRIVAISHDKPEVTAEALDEYGAFGFPLLSDPGNAVSALYGCTELPTSESDGLLKHGTYLLDSEGTVTWVNTGLTPFVDNRSLLVHLAKLQKHHTPTLAAK